MFASFLSSLSKQWQVVDEHGDVVDDHGDVVHDHGDVGDDDETSSVGSDWSFMHLDDGSNLPDRPRSLNRSEPSSQSRSRDDHHSGLPNSLDSPVRQDFDDRAISRPARPAQPTTTRPRGAANATLVGDRSTRKTNRPNPAESRQAAARWNTAVHVNGRHSHRNKLNVDAQRAKCLRRGPQNSNGFQRVQVRLMSGGQLPQGRNFAASKN